MARPISDEELQLKKRARRRVVGAIVLVTAVAVILPMVLDSEPKSSSNNVDIQIPSPDAGEFKPKSPGARSATAEPSKALPSVAEKRGAQSASAKAESTKPESGPAEISSIKEPTAVNDAAKEPVTAKAVPSENIKGMPPAPAKQSATAPETVPREAPAAAAGVYVVQVAALSDSAKAKQLEKQMAGVGLKTYTEVVNTQSGEVTRVRAGPYATREAAEKARTQLKKAGLDGKVVPK